MGKDRGSERERNDIPGGDPISIHPGGVVDEWLQSVEGSIDDLALAGKPIYCDSCTAAVDIDTFGVTAYGADNDIGDIEAKGVFTLMHIYCLDCTVGEIQFPCGGYNEILVRGTITSDREWADLEVLDVSGKKSGLVWDPKAVFERLLDIDYDEANRRASHYVGVDEMMVGPEDVVVFATQAGIEITEIVDPETGEIAADETWRDLRERFDAGVKQFNEQSKKNRRQAQREHRDRWS